MNNAKSFHHPSQSNACTRKRIAESSIAAVDACDCGMLHLHIGAITLRLAPCAISELLATLGEAVARQTAERICTDLGEPVPFLSKNGRGDA
jgi:hypothetical protein